MGFSLSLQLPLLFRCFVFALCYLILISPVVKLDKVCGVFYIIVMMRFVLGLCELSLNLLTITELLPQGLWVLIRQDKNPRATQE